MEFRGRHIEDPPFVRTLFSDPTLAWIWLIARVYIGYQWITSGWGKFNNPAWVDSGDALKGFLERVVVVPETGRAAISFDWYRSFIQTLLDTESYTWFAKVIVAGELLVGLALILGAFVGIAAVFGGVMNFNFMLAGTASSNPVMFGLAVLLIMAWKTAGYYGLDYYVLRFLGTPWKREAEGSRAEMKMTGGAAPST